MKFDPYNRSSLYIELLYDVAPLRPADEAVILDSDHLNADEVFERVLELCR